jgi:thioredoxin reductase (NADPH)
MKQINQQPIQCLIIGSGPAGYTAAIYAARAGLNPVLIQGLQPGGQLTTTTEVDNYPGYPKGVQGVAMMEDFKEQALRFGTDIRFAIVTKVNLSVFPLEVEIDHHEIISSYSVIISTGATAKWLGLESEQRLNGLGVSACAVCDGFFFKGKDVAIVGAGDTAAEEATYLAKICSKVYMIIRKDTMRASKAMQQRVLNTPNIEVFYSSETQEIIGTDHVTGVRLLNTITNESTEKKVDGFFVAIGHTPNTELFKGQLEMRENGYIATLPGSAQTNVKGVFAAGDVQDHVYRQAITSAGSGCMAALDAERFLKTIEMSSDIKTR